MNSTAASRKDDHIRLADAQQHQLADHPVVTDYDRVEILHHALAGISPETTTTHATLGPWQLVAPLYINGMTGGTEQAREINRALAQAAAATGIPMASGSVGIGLDEPSTADSFRVIREENPDGLIWANIGAGRSVEDAHRAVDLLDADALQVHLNAIQETVMVEGSRDFSNWLGLLEDIVRALEPDGVPVIIKEVGFGLSARTLGQLRDIGVTIADVAGSGGTNFARIENDRRASGEDPIAQAGNWEWITQLGSSAARCLLDAHATGILSSPHQLAEHHHCELQVLASGGVRHPLDVVRALALGARAVGVAGTFLTIARHHGAETLTEVIRIWLTRIRQLMVLLGAHTVEELQYTDVILHGPVREFALARGVDLAQLANRSGKETR
ncbi:type 2 isopentenyl-diphosphate Delta-isomerase [Auritidibacter ignavus]|uniref:type 2 isopentenyl-diphosphate Delta-isomerase n=1 Tax=Auritidibacter TaxID=1160973 RepID=UPI000D73DAF2|nr:MULTISPECIES: type 2 isopentenyl-diphosphate Delta-isomerase [Auritidibacter]AXR74761.1 type 2 isopentenyl-diphosphate Delta-isomerase [Auritidibacter sp. NML130574]WGH81299.1 type 2 isopentenyl-diphosphate Delta-isomerase [Auritidibacter ignavus]